MSRHSLKKASPYRPIDSARRLLPRRQIAFAELYGFQEQMRAHRGRRSRVQPKIRMDFDMRELSGGLAQMRVKARIPSFFFPHRVDLSGGVTEYRAEVVLDAHGFAKFFFDGVDAYLRDVGPDA